MIENNNQDDLIIDKISPHVMSKLQKKKYFSKRNIKYLFCIFFIGVIFTIIYVFLIKKRNCLIENNKQLSDILNLMNNEIDILNPKINQLKKRNSILEKELLKLEKEEKIEKFQVESTQKSIKETEEKIKKIKKLIEELSLNKKI
jgi:septal ring factor EnvC (AmiA/AmiB activator)